MNKEEKILLLNNESEQFCEIIQKYIDVYKLTSKTDESYVIWDKIKEEFEITNTPRNTSSSIQIKLIKLGWKFQVFERRHIIPTLIENNLVSEVNDLGFKPNKDKIFEIENKIYLNIFKRGEFEDKYFKNNIEKISLHEGINKYDFPELLLLFKHLIGDERIYYRKNLNYLNKIKVLNENEKLDFQNIINILKTDNIDSIKNHFLNKLEELENNQDYSNLIENKINYFLKWFSFIIQFPEFKLPNGLVFQSTPGVGKDRLIEWVLIKVFGINNIKSIGQDDIGKYNDYVEGMRFVICNELEFRRTNTAMYDQIKRLMTNKHIAVQGKFKSIKNIINFSNFLFFGNADNIMRIEQGDRRFSVFRQKFKIPKSITIKLSPELNPGYLEKELGQFTKFLYSISVDFSEIEKPLMTEEKNEIINYHKSDIDSFIDDMKEYYNLESAVKNLTTNFDEIKPFKPFFALSENSEIIEKEPELIPNDIVFKLFLLNNKHKQIHSNRQNNSFQKALTNKGFHTTEPQYSKILGSQQRHRFLFEIFPYAKELREQKSSIVETIDVSKFVKNKIKVEE